MLNQLNTNNRQEEPNRDGIQLCVKTLQRTMTTTQAVKCRRFAGPKSLSHPKKKTQWNVPSTDVIAVTRKKIEKHTEKQKLTGSSPRTHEVSALEASSSRNCRYVRPSPDPPAGARRHRLVCPGTGHAQRAEILPFRNARGRFLSQRGCTVNSDRTEKEDKNEFCLIKVRVPPRLPVVQ